MLTRNLHILVKYSLIASLTTALEETDAENAKRSRSGEAVRSHATRQGAEEGESAWKMQTELDELKRKCEILERTRATSDKRCKEVEERAEQEADQVAAIVENLRLSMEEQLDELRQEHDKVLQERDAAESQLQVQLTAGER